MRSLLRDPRFSPATVEKAGAFAVIAVTVMHLFLYLEQMMSSSMWTDELGSIKFFFARGPWYVVTHYPIPRNHIFFSLLSSLIPGAGAGIVDPIRAQGISYVFAAVLGVGILWYFFRQRRYFEGALMFGIWGLSGDLIQLSLQARGYGLLGLFAFCSSVLAVRFCETRRLRDFVLLGVCTVLGAYTVPSYVFFGGSLMALLCLRERDRWGFGITVAAAGCIVLLYAPVMRELIQATVTYKQEYGEQYVGIRALTATVVMFLWRLPDWLAMGLFCGVMILPFAIFPPADRKARALQCLNLAVLIFLAACLLMRTPPVRTTSFIALPVAFCAVEVASRCVRSMRRPVEGFVFGAVLLFCGLGMGLHAVSDFRFFPYENWLGAWRFLSTMYPPGTVIDCSRTAEGITYYIDPDRYKMAGDSVDSRDAFAAGELPVVIGKWKGRRERKPDPFNENELSDAGVRVTLPCKIRDVSTCFAVPKVNAIQSIKASFASDLTALTDRNLRTALTVTGDLLLHFDEKSSIYSLNILFDDVTDVQVSVRAKTAAKEWEIEESKVERIGDCVTVPLGGEAVQSAVLRMRSVNGPLRVREIWANQAPNAPPAGHASELTAPPRSFTFSTLP